MSVQIKKPIANDLLDLSRAKVHQSHLFAVTNVSAGVLTAAAVTLTVVGTTMTGIGGVQIWQDAVTDSTIPTLMTGIGGAVGGILLALPAQWLATYDDNIIEEHNQRGLRARFRSTAGKKYEQAQELLVEALREVDYNPHTARLPSDALGYLAIMPDKLLAKLPPHIRMDAYRTQADLILSKYSGMCSHECVEGVMIEEQVIAEGLSMEDKAERYREMRNYVHAKSADATLEVTPLPEHMRGRHVDEKRGYGFKEFMDDMLDGMARSSSSSSRRRHDDDGVIIFWGNNGGGGSSSGSTSGNLGNGRIGDIGSRNYGGFKTGGGFGGEGFITGGGIAAAPIPMPTPIVDSGAVGSGDMLGGLMDSFGGSGGSSSRSNSSSKNDGAAAILLLVVAAVAIGVAVAVVSGAVHKSYFKRAATPRLNGVDLPWVSQSLKSIKGEVDKMYKAHPKVAPQVA